jgi:hypothetical protein
VTLAEILAVCDEYEAAGLKSATLVVPRGLYPRGFPRGELLCENADRGRVYRFKTQALRRMVQRVTREAMDDLL